MTRTRRHARTWLLATLALTLAACGPATPAAPDAPATATQPAGDPVISQTAPIVVMLGDSLTAGYQLPPGNALPAALQRDFDARDVSAKFINAGVSGDTTADGLARYDWSVTGSKADLLVLALGANDFLNGLPPETPKKNLAALIERAQADRIPVLLVGVAIPNGSTAADSREAAYAAIYPALSQQYGVPYYPDMLGAIAGQPALIQQDGVHPTADGVEAMAIAITEFLAPIVVKLPRD